ncbi:MAG: metal ABC transporter permease [Clostridia bacterium]|nr:metal ABC transporter permease [Clostridia bacterium]
MEMIYSVMENILPFSWVEYTFMKNALIAILLAAPLFGLVGTMIVNNKMSFFSDAMGHCALTGIAIGVMLGIENYAVSMLAFAILFAIGIASIIESDVSSSDTIIGVFSSAGIAVGIVILSANGGFSKYSGYLVGDILSITKNEILLLAIIFLVVISVWIFSFNKLMLASLNADMAKSKRINVKLYKNLFAVLIALIVTVSIKWVGMLIINSLLVLPAAAAKNIVKSMRAYHIVSVLFSLFSGICGLVLSYYIGTSAGATIVLISSIIFFGTFFVNRFYNLN